MVAILAGGTGGAKLARGLLDVVGPGSLAVIANTGDDIDVYGVHVSPDPDLVTYWLGDAIDEQQGFGIRGDSFRVMDALAAAGRDTWFRLGDRDLATCLVRTEMLSAGRRLTEAAARVAAGLDVRAQVLPMSDGRVRTHVLSGRRRLSLQEFLIVEHGAAPIEGVELEGVESAAPTPEALEAIRTADTIVIGPSNPVISIGPVLAVPGMREAIREASAPVVAISPFVRGEAVKGPTEAFCRHAGIRTGAVSVLDAYGDLLDGVVADESLEGADAPLGASEHARVTTPPRRPTPPSLVVDTLMDSPERRASVAGATLEFAAALRPELAPKRRAR